MIKSLNLAALTMLLASPVEAVAGTIGSTVNITTTTSSYYPDRITEVLVVGQGTYTFPDPHAAPDLSQTSMAIDAALAGLGFPMGTVATSQGTVSIGSDSTSEQSYTSNYNPIDNPDYVVGDPDDPYTWIAVGSEDVNVFVTVTENYYTYYRLTADIVQACAPGSFSATGNEPCTPCGAGTFELDSGSTACDPCPGGQATPCNGNGTCSDGPTGNGTCTCDAGYTGFACENGPPTTTTTSMTTTTTIAATTTTSVTTTSTTSTTLPGECTALPRSGCVVAAKAGLQISTKSDPAKNKLKWKLGGGSLAVDYADLGDPATATTWTLCIYDSAPGDPYLAGFVEVGPSASWTGKSPKGWKYKDKAGSQDGVSGLSLSAGAAGKTKAQLKGAGTNLPLPLPVSAAKFFHQTSAVTVQLVKDGGAGADVCWSSEFVAGDTKSNSPDSFKAAAK